MRAGVIYQINEELCYAPHSAWLATAVRLSLKVVPGASVDEISGWLGDSLKIRVRAPAESGKANAAVTQILAATLGLHKRAVTIISGGATARKVVEIDGLTAAEVRARLAGHGIASF